MANELASQQIRMTPDQINLLKNTVARGASHDELQLFVSVAQRRGLDPFTKQIHFVKRWNASSRTEEGTFQTGIDGFRLIAQRSQKYAGQLGPYWCGEDGVWTDVWLGTEPPAAAKSIVLRHDFKEPLSAVATFSTYVQLKRDGTPNAFWARMGALMLAKCAESLALRKAFPEELSGLYSDEEMMQADATPAPTTPPPTAPAPPTVLPPQAAPVRPRQSGWDEASSTPGLPWNDSR